MADYLRGKLVTIVRKAEGGNEVMADFANEIAVYLDDMSDFETSPFEMHHALFLRSELEKKWAEMNSVEQLALIKADLEVIKNAEKVVSHLGGIYDFSTSDKPDSEWWWHLDKVANGEIEIKGNPLLVLQEEEAEESIKADVEKDPQLKQMIQESQSEYEKGKGMTTKNLLRSISVEDFE